MPMLHDAVRGTLLDRERFSKLFDAVVAVKDEEFCIRPSDERVTPTNDGDHVRVDYGVHGAELVPGMFPHFVVNMRQLGADGGRSQFVSGLMANRDVLEAGGGEREVHVRRGDGKMHVGISDFSNQPEREFELDISALVAQGARDVADKLDDDVKKAPQFPFSSSADSSRGTGWDLGL